LGTVDQDQANWFSGANPEYEAVTLIAPGRDGSLADGSPLTVYQLVNSKTVISSLTENNDLLDQYSKGVTFQLNKRFSQGWAMIFGYTFQHIDQAAASVSNPNNELVNASGVSGGRAHDFKLTGTFQLPYQIVFGVNGRLDSGLPITRTWTIPACTATVTTECLSVATTVNAEPRGDFLLPWLGTMDLRFGRFFNLGSNRFEVSFDIYNITNANTIFSVRTNTGTVTVFENNNPALASQVIPAFDSPTGVTAPRIARINLTWSFGAR
jgi:hypothetical protein